MATKTKKATDEKETTTLANAILKDARITEKAAGGAQYSIYLFNVAVGVTKSEIAKAFQTKYGKKPVKVNTVNIMPKTRVRRGRVVQGTHGKKAYVFLPKGVTIDVI